METQHEIQILDVLYCDHVFRRACDLASACRALTDLMNLKTERKEHS
jgi:hypothetical protein